MFEHSPVPVIFRFVGTPEAEYVVYTAVMMGAQFAAALAIVKARNATIAIGRSLFTDIPCWR